MGDFDDIGEIISAAAAAATDAEARMIVEANLGNGMDARAGLCWHWVQEIREDQEFRAEVSEEQFQRRAARRAGLKCWGAYQRNSGTLKKLAAAEKSLLAAFPETVIEAEDGCWVVSEELQFINWSLLALYEQSGQDSDKLREIVKLNQEGCSFSVAAEILALPDWKRSQALAGLRWLRDADSDTNYDCSVEVLRKLGRECKKDPDMCWVLLRAPSKLAAARKNRALRFSCFPRKVQWKRLLELQEVPAEFIMCSPEGFKVRTFKRLVQEFDLYLDRDRTACGVSGMTSPLLNLVRLLGDYEAIVRFVRVAGHPWTAKGVHDAGQFRLAGSGWTPARWAPLALRNPAVLKYARDFPSLEKANLFPHSLEALKRALLARTYPKIEPEWQKLADVCQDLELSSSTFSTYRKFWQTVKVKPAEFLPPVTVRGSEVGLDDSWKFEKLAADDYRGPMLGLLTGCCQHLEGAGSSCARHGVTSPFSAFYAVTHNGRIVAQSWCWLRDSAVVIDSVESVIRDRDQLDPVLRLYKAAVPRWLDSSLGIKTVCIGQASSGITSEVLEAVKPNWEKEPLWSLAPTDECAYRDAHHQVCVAGSKAKKMPKLKIQVEGYKQKEGTAKWSAVADGYHLDDLQMWDLRRRIGDMQAFDFA